MRAITHEVYAESESDEPRGQVRPTLFTGPPRPEDGPVLGATVEMIPPDPHPTAGPDHRSRVRPTRVPADLGAELDAVARAHKRRGSDIVRDALAEHITTHRA